MDELGHLGWVAKHSFELDGRLFGIRTDSKDFSRWLAKNLPATVVRDEEANANYSVVVGRAEGTVGKRFHILYRGATAIARTLDAVELIDALLADIDSVRYWKRRDAVYLEASLLSADEVTGLFPEELLGIFGSIKRHARTIGLRFPSSRFVSLDPETADAVPDRRTLEVSDEAIAELAATIGSETTDWPRTAVERPMSIDVVCIKGHGGPDGVRTTSRGWALYVLAGLAANLSELGEAGLETLRRLVARANCFEIGSDDNRLMADSASAVLRRFADERAQAIA